VVSSAHANQLPLPRQRRAAGLESTHVSRTIADLYLYYLDYYYYKNQLRFDTNLLPPVWGLRFLELGVIIIIFKNMQMSVTVQSISVS